MTEEDKSTPNRFSRIAGRSTALVVAAMATVLLGVQLAIRVGGVTLSSIDTTVHARDVSRSASENLDTRNEVGIRTDRRVYAEPPLPVLPRAGGIIRDPVFGTQIMRATDAGDYRVPGCGTYYNQWPTFNADNTRLLIRCGSSGDMLIKAFDPVTFTLGSTLRKTPNLHGTTFTWEGATWSNTDPDLIFVHADYFSRDYPASGMKLYAYRPSTNTFTLLKDFAPELAPGQPDYLFEMHVAQDEIFTFMQKRVGSNVNPIFFIVWKRSTNKILHHLKVDASFDMNNCNPDKSGRYVYCGPNNHLNDRKIFDLQTGRIQTMSWNAKDDPGAHGDLGQGTLVTRGAFSGNYTIRKLSDVHTITATLFDNKDARGKKDWSNDSHTSLNANNEDWALLGLFDDPNSTDPVTETGAYENELMQVSMRDPNQIRRLLHHHSVVDGKTETSGYWAAPKPTISKDGQFVAFTSNWGKSGRYDLFIAKIDPAPRLTGISKTPQSAPSSLIRQRRVTEARPSSSRTRQEN